MKKPEQHAFEELRKRQAPAVQAQKLVGQISQSLQDLEFDRARLRLLSLDPPFQPTHFLCVRGCEPPPPAQVRPGEPIRIAGNPNRRSKDSYQPRDGRESRQPIREEREALVRRQETWWNDLVQLAEDLPARERPPGVESRDPLFGQFLVTQVPERLSEGSALHVGADQVVPQGRNRSVETLREEETRPHPIRRIPQPERQRRRLRRSRLQEPELAAVPRPFHIDQAALEVQRRSGPKHQRPQFVPRTGFVAILAERGWKLAHQGSHPGTRSRPPGVHQPQIEPFSRRDRPGIAGGGFDEHALTTQSRSRRDGHPRPARSDGALYD